MAPFVPPLVVGLTAYGLLPWQPVHTIAGALEAATEEDASSLSGAAVPSSITDLVDRLLP